MTLYVTRREQCLRNLKTLLAGITVANGYTFTVTKVERAVRNWDDPEVRGSYPYIGFATVADVPDPQGVGVLYMTMELVLVAYIDRESSGDLASDQEGHTALNALQDAIIARLGAGPTLGGYAIHSRWGTWKPNDGEVFDDGVWIRGWSATLYVEYERSSFAST